MRGRVEELCSWGAIAFSKRRSRIEWLPLAPDMLVAPVARVMTRESQGKRMPAARPPQHGLDVAYGPCPTMALHLLSGHARRGTRCSAQRVMRLHRVQHAGKVPGRLALSSHPGVDLRAQQQDERQIIEKQQHDDGKGGD